MTVVTMLIALSGVLGIVQIIPYIVSILRGITKPSRVANGIWLASNVITVASMWATGARAAVALPIAFTLTNAISLTLSITHGAPGLSRTDMVNGLVAVAALAAWVVLGPRAAVISMAFAQITANLAVVSKARRLPRTEDRLAWALAGFAGLASIAAIIAEGRIDVAVLSVPMLSTLGCIVIVGLSTAQERAHRKGTKEPVAAYAVAA